MRNVILISVTLLMLSARAVPTEYRASLMDDWLSASFTNVEAGVELSSDLGAKGGSWGDPAVPESASAVVEEDSSGVRSLSFDTSESLGNINFTADTVAPRDTIFVNFTMMYSKVDMPFAMPSDVQTALMIVQPTGKSPCFMGFSRNGWTTLLAEGVSPAFDTWYVAQARFQKFAGVTKVSYWVCMEGVYRPLQDADGTAWFEVACVDDEFWNQISFDGVGQVSTFDGKFFGQGLRISVNRGDAK